jgi:hypothetical protein
LDNKNIIGADKMALKEFKNVYVGYIQDTEISKKIKEQFANNPTIVELKNNYDIFIFFKELEDVGPDKKPWFLSFAEIIWKDGSIVFKRVTGNSEISKKDATKAMFEKLEHGEFVKS